MSRANESAYPIQGSDLAGTLEAQHGLTIREHFAAMAMQAILTGAVTRGCPGHEWTDQDMAVKCADALIAELAKPPAPMQTPDYCERVARAVVSAATGLPNGNIPQTDVTVDAKSGELFQIVLIALEQVTP